MAKNLILWVIIAVVLMAVFNAFSPQQTRVESLTYSDFQQSVENGGIRSVTIDGRRKIG